MFEENPQQASRTRNYYSPDIHVPSLTVNWNLSALTKLEFTSSAILGNRSSVQFDKPGSIADTINRSTLNYNNRQVDRDFYHSFTNQLRVLHQYKTVRQLSSLAAGVQYMKNDWNSETCGGIGIVILRFIAR